MSFGERASERKGSGYPHCTDSRALPPLPPDPARHCQALGAENSTFPAVPRSLTSETTARPAAGHRGGGRAAAGSRRAAVSPLAARPGARPAAAAASRGPGWSRGGGEPRSSPPGPRTPARGAKRNGGGRGRERTEAARPRAVGVHKRGAPALPGDGCDRCRRV